MSQQDSYIAFQIFTSISSYGSSRGKEYLLRIIHGCVGAIDTSPPSRHREFNDLAAHMNGSALTQWNFVMPAMTMTLQVTTQPSGYSTARLVIQQQALRRQDAHRP